MCTQTLGLRLALNPLNPLSLVVADDMVGVLTDLLCDQCLDFEQRSQRSLSLSALAGAGLSD